jgi:hypothetical protein
MESMTYRSYPQNPQMPVDNCLIILIGGEGAVAGRDNCGSIRPPEKAKLKKIGVGAGSSDIATR